MSTTVVCTAHRAVTHTSHIKSQWSFVLHVTVQYLSAFNLMPIDVHVVLGW